MASYSEGCGRLTGYQYSLLGLCISCTNMEVIALGYMGIDMEKLKNLKEARRKDKEGFVRDVIETWAYRHPDNQIQNLAHLLYKAAGNGYVNAHKIEEILGVPLSSLNSTPQQRQAAAPKGKLLTKHYMSPL